MLRKTLLAFALCLSTTVAMAVEFPDPSKLTGEALPAADLKALVAQAMKTTPPRNGKSYVFGFANLQRDIAFGILTENGIVKNAEAAGVELRITDNRLDGPTALQNAQSYISRNVDFVIEFQTDANFGPQIMRLFDNAKIPVIAIDIPMRGATFFGVNNPKAGYMGGSYLAQAAVAKWGLDAVRGGYFIVGALPQSGAVPRMRTEGQIRGFLDSIPGFPKEHLIEIDSKNTLQESFTQTRNVLNRIPKEALIFATGINDQSTTGIIRACQEGGRAAKSIGVGLGADELRTLDSDPQFIASVASFPERSGNYLIPMALYALSGKTLPPGVLVHHIPLAKYNIGDYYPEYANKGSAGFTYIFPSQNFNKYLAELRQADWLKDYQALIPADE